jgi:hypothetical protein
MKLIKDYPPETQWQTRNGQQTGRHCLRDAQERA